MEEFVIVTFPSQENTYITAKSLEEAQQIISNLEQTTQKRYIAIPSTFTEEENEIFEN